MADIRQFKTNQNIQEALIKLMDTIDFDQITVDNICKSALTSRSTFYLHYQDKYDLINQIIDDEIEHFESVIKLRIDGLMSREIEETITDFYNDMQDRRLTIQVLFKTHNQQFHLKEIFKNTLYNYWLNYLGQQTHVVPNQLLASFSTSIVFDTLIWTFEHGKDTDVFNFVENIRKNLI